MYKESNSAPTPTANPASSAALSKNRQKTHVEEAVGRLRQLDLADRFDLTAFLEYCSYVSANAHALGLEDFDTRYSVDEVRRNLGNEYLATEFVEYYAGLCSQNPALPDLRGISFRTHDLSGAILLNSQPLGMSPAAFMRDDDGTVALSSWFGLAGFYSSDVMGKQVAGLCSPMSIANLLVRLADVRDKSVLDFACGNGIFLSTALANGAATVYGRDINAQAVTRARILCFFADPANHHDVAEANSLTAASTTMSAQRVFVAPPLGMRLREFDIPEKGYYAAVLASVMGKGVANTPNMEDFCVAKAFSSLTDDGVAILHVSASFLFHQQKARQSLRRALVEGGHLQAVIELPGGCVPGTGVKSALLVIAKQPTDEGVLIVDLDSKELAGKGYVKKGRGRCEITDAGIDWLVEVVQNRDEIPLVSTVADRETVLASGSNLCYSAYGDVLDYGSILAETRSTEDIMGDIEAAQASVDSLSEQIAGILKSIEEKGR